MASVSPAPALSGLENALGKGAKLRDIFLWSMLVVVFVFVATVLLLWFRAWLKYRYSPREPERAFWRESRQRSRLSWSTRPFRYGAARRLSTELDYLPASAQPSSVSASTEPMLKMPRESVAGVLEE